MQGATDVDVACCIFAAAGAFAAAPLADTLVLVAGDSDFRPALEAVLAARGGMVELEEGLRSALPRLVGARPEDEPTCIVHGDYRLGNLIVRADGGVADASASIEVRVRGVKASHVDGCQLAVYSRDAGQPAATSARVVPPPGPSR